MLIILLLFILSVLLSRIYVIGANRSSGCDAYYFLLTAEIFKKNKKIPITLPDYYLLDIPEQWYPPLFSVFLSFIPRKLLAKYYWLINPALDMLNLCLLLFIEYKLTHSLAAVLVAGLTYACTLTLFLEGLNLNSRFLGNFFLSLYILFFYIFIYNDNPIFLVCCLIAGCLILLTHKMTFQFVVLFSLILSIGLLTFWPIFILFLSIIFTVIISGGFFIKVLRGHYDIISFWNRNWAYLGAHQVYDSPIFQGSKEGNLTRNKILTNLDVFHGVRLLLIHQPFLPLVLILIILLKFPAQNVLLDINILWVLSGILIFLITTFIDKFKLFGEGSKYIKFVALPCALLLGYKFSLLHGNQAKFFLTAWIGTLVLIVSAVIRKYKLGWFEKNNAVISEDIKKLLDFLNANNKIDYILCLPPVICDAIVYYTRKHVLWGTHHYLFNERVFDFYPVLRHPLEYFINKYNIRYFLIDKSYVQPKILGLEQPIAEYGSWQVYKANKPI